MSKEFTHLPQQTQQSMHEPEPLSLSPSPQQKKPGSKRTLMLVLLFILMVGVTAFNLMSTAPAQKYVDRYERDVQLARAERKEQEKVELQEIEEMYSSQDKAGLACSVPPSRKAKQRISYGQPRPKPSQMRLVIIQKKSPGPQKLCLLTNSINILTPKTLQTGRALLTDPSFHKWLIFIGLIDDVGESLIRGIESELRGQGLEVIKAGEVEVDGEYGFVRKFVGGCELGVYVQNVFVVGRERVAGFVEEVLRVRDQYPEGFVGYTQYMYDEKGKEKKLLDLRTVDLSTLKQQTMNQHIFTFPTTLLQTSTPLNYSPYTKYTLEQLLITPLLALTQKTHLVPLQGAFYTFDQVVVQFKEFAVKQVSGRDTCFVVYPVESGVFDVGDLEGYLGSVGGVEDRGRRIGVVVWVGYHWGMDEDLFQLYKLVRKYLDRNTNLRIRLRIVNQAASPAQAAYESAHSYCQKSSLVITSRSNIRFHKRFFLNIEGSISQKNHYLYPMQGEAKNSMQMRDIVQPREGHGLRFGVQEYFGHLADVQIFKAELMRMVHLWALKGDQDQFYQTEAAFIFPMIQMADTAILAIEKLYEVSKNRTPSQKQLAELQQLQKYSRWNRIKDKLQPIPFNSLTNPDLRPGNLPQIPKIIHQVNFRPEPLPERIQALQSTVKRVNKDYEYRMWTMENFTTWDFPMSYALVAGVLEYAWAEGRDLEPWVQALVSYQALYNHGGIYIDLRAQAKRSLDPFLKYQLFFSGFYSHPGSESSPITLGRQIMGAKRYSYHLRFVLTQLITQQTINYNCIDMEAIVGGDVLRTSLTDNQLFTTVAFGFHLFNYDAYRKGKGFCGDEPNCQRYKGAYLVMHYYQ